MKKIFIMHFSTRFCEAVFLKVFRTKRCFVRNSINSKSFVRLVFDFLTRKKNEEKKVVKIHNKVPEMEYFFTFFDLFHEKFFFDPVLISFTPISHATNLQNLSFDICCGALCLAISLSLQRENNIVAKSSSTPPFPPFLISRAKHVP